MSSENNKSVRKVDGPKLGGDRFVVERSRLLYDGQVLKEWLKENWMGLKKVEIPCVAGQSRTVVDREGAFLNLKFLVGSFFEVGEETLNLSRNKINKLYRDGFNAREKWADYCLTIYPLTD